VISARSIRKGYRDGASILPVLEGLNLEVREKEFVAIVGPSGSGKSTLLHILGGLDVNYQGRVEVGGVELGRLNDAGLARFRNREVGFVFQSFHLIPNLTAFENVLLPAFFDQCAINADHRKRAAEVLGRVGIAVKSQRVNAQLSGGERQRVAIARALLLRPRVLLCDEPTGNLDEGTGAEIIGIFRQLHREGLTILAVTHEERISNAAERVLRLRQGTLEDASTVGEAR
jgi:putative ABC transport system ATP-binding protein